jgi:hypothetical protein
MRSFSPILSHTETSVPFGDFYISVSRLRSMSSREVRYTRLDFFVLLYQDKRTKEIKSDIFRSAAAEAEENSYFY